MADTEISIFSFTNATVQDRNFIIETYKSNDLISSQVNYSDKIYDLQAKRFDSQIKEVENYEFNLQTVRFAGISVLTSNSSARTYLMRARKNSDNSIIYWRTSTIDYSAVESGYQLNAIKELCVVAYD